MRVCGIIAEYDPFHLGHRYHMEKARELSGADYIVVALACAFSQRGEAMLFETHDRARMALLSGADLVLGIPASFSCAQANRFARGGVSILNSLGAATHLSFGCEPDSGEYLSRTADLLHHPPIAFSRTLRTALDTGKSFAHAQGEALSACLPDVPPAVFANPNFILGVSYFLELKRLCSPICALPVVRAGEYHAHHLSPLPSATAVRHAFGQGCWQGIRASVPPESFFIIRDAAENGRLHQPHALDPWLMGTLNVSGLASLKRSPEMSEGLERRILAKARQAKSREELLDLINTRRYTRSRVNRALSHALLGLTNFPDRPSYARLLGFRRSAVPLLKRIKSTSIPLVDRPGRNIPPGFLEEMRTEEFWALGAGRAMASAWRYPVQVIN
ncbi:MAG: nucleotidyltransferase family protein [Clostridiales bacterium]|jgi:predicted nucleotidyltransferase|nr:nucleotidyltransferase family protein [Clostridiales bacterium]